MESSGRDLGKLINKVIENPEIIQTNENRTKDERQSMGSHGPIKQST